MAARIRVLEWITTPLGTHGLPLYALRMAEHMPGIQADFLTWRVDEPRLEERVKALGGQLYVVEGRLRHPLQYMFRARRLLRQQHYDLVHCHGNSCTLAMELWAAKSAGVPIRIAHSHNSHGRYPLLHRLLRPSFDRRYTRAMACSQEAGEWLFGGQPFQIAPNAIDPEAFTYDEEVRRELRAQWGWEKTFVVGCVGGFTEVKNQSFLLDAFAVAQHHRPELKLVLVGEGELFETILARVHALGLREHVRLTGQVPYVDRILSAMDLLAMPSLHEGLPTAALEAQCEGLPALLSEDIDRACALTNRARFLPLKQERWIAALRQAQPIPREEASRQALQVVRARGLSLTEAALQMQQIYLKELEAAGRWP